MKKARSRGQVFTLDMFVAVIGLVIVLSYAGTWYQQAFSGADRIEQMKLDQIAQDIAQTAVKEALAYHDEYGNRYPNLIKGTPDEIKKKMQDLMTQTLGGEYAGEIILVGAQHVHIRSCDHTKELVGLTWRTVYYDDGSGAVPAVLVVSVCQLQPDEQVQGLEPSNMPNLKASITVDPHNPNPDSDVTVTLTVANDGQQDAGQQFKAEVRLDDAVSGEVIQSYVFSGLSAGGSITRQFTYSVSGLDGSHTLYAIVDTENTVTETSETDNIASTVFTVGLPDLVVLSIDPDKDGYFTLGEPVTGNYTVRNAGIGDAIASAQVEDDVTLEVPLPSDGGITLHFLGRAIPFPVLLQAGDNLFSGGSVTRGFSVDYFGMEDDLGISESTPERNCILTVWTDDTVTPVINESNEDNNKKSATIHIGLPNLRGDISLHRPDGREFQKNETGAYIIPEGQNVVMKAIIENNRTYDVIDKFIVTAYIVNKSAEGPIGSWPIEKYPREISYLPRHSTETFKYTFVTTENIISALIGIDPQQKINESDESDNFPTVQIKPVPGYVDLQVDGISIEPKNDKPSGADAYEYEPVDWNITIRNDGNVDYNDSITLNLSGLGVMNLSNRKVSMIENNLVTKSEVFIPAGMRVSLGPDNFTFSEPEGDYFTLYGEGSIPIAANISWTNMTGGEQISTLTKDFSVVARQFVSPVDKMYKSIPSCQPTDSYDFETPAGRLFLNFSIPGEAVAESPTGFLNSFLEFTYNYSVNKRPDETCYCCAWESVYPHSVPFCSWGNELYKEISCVYYTESNGLITDKINVTDREIPNPYKIVLEIDCGEYVSCYPITVYSQGTTLSGKYYCPSGHADEKGRCV